MSAERYEQLPARVDKLEHDRELLHEKLDILITEVRAATVELRGSRLHRERTEKWMKESSGRSDAIEAGVLEAIGISKNVGGELREMSARVGAAERLARAAYDREERSSWTDEVAKEATQSMLAVRKAEAEQKVHIAKAEAEQRIHLAQVEADEKMRARAKANATKLKILYAFAIVLLGALGSWIKTLL